METKSRYEVLADLQKEKAVLIRERDTQKDEVNNRQDEIKQIKRALEDRQELLKDFVERLEERKNMINALIENFPKPCKLKLYKTHYGTVLY